MKTVRLAEPDDFDGWRNVARGLIAAGVKPEDVTWQVGEDGDLFGGEADIGDGPAFSVPRSFVALAKSVICNRDPQRFALLYRLLFDLKAGTCKMDDAADPLLRKLEMLAKAVRRDIHKMRAFVRFRSITTEHGETFIAWFEPEHHIVRANAEFFTSRFANMRWSILTPDISLHWDAETLREGPAARREDAPADDAVEAQWHAYYRSIFNPARLKVQAMLKEMPRKYWRNMPETTLVPQMIAGAQARMTEMIDRHVPEAVAQTLDDLREDAVRCRRCPLYGPATQIVFGQGPQDAPLMFVGEQPGDEEDLAGRPFVGPAGRLLNEALREAGIERDRLYITNAVKHFKYEPQGKRRIHQRPNIGEVNHCRWWLTREIEIVRPRLIVALGATAIRSLTGKQMTIKDARANTLFSSEGVPVLGTIHPSFLLRLPDPILKGNERHAFIADLRRAQEQVTAMAA